ncbi:hypothetical protein [Paenibacillus sp. GCM10027626]|uniref:hypothetical protein n=1 Tax=Paenibacillus sp. GCM10027626 TaxID=3273411 RepID=UPI00362777C4
MRSQKILGVIATLLTLSVLLLACSEASRSSSDLPKPPDPSEELEGKPFQINAEDIVRVTITDLTEEIEGIIDQEADIKELSEILNNASPYSGATTADFYGLFTFSMKDGSETKLKFSSHGAAFIDIKAQQGYMLDRSKVKALNALVDRIKKE